MSHVAIIDYKMSNLFSVKHACDFVGLNAVITSDIKTISSAQAAILPGVGAFGDAMQNLKQLGLVSAIKKFIASGKPFLGICLGLQLLFTESEEFQTHKGLNIIKGNVVKFKSAEKQIKVPQIGWNQIKKPDVPGKNKDWSQTSLKEIKEGEFMYFVHSYYVVPKDEKVTLTVTDYEGIQYCSSILKDNILATQFHPEKSGPEGIKIYQQWASAINRS